jgi:hypothetical protein
MRADLSLQLKFWVPQYYLFNTAGMHTSDPSTPPVGFYTPDQTFVGTWPKSVFGDKTGRWTAGKGLWVMSKNLGAPPYLLVGEGVGHESPWKVYIFCTDTNGGLQLPQLRAGQELVLGKQQEEIDPC